MNFLNSLRAYAQGWVLKSKRPFSKEELDSIEEVSIVDREEGYGPSVCMVMKERDTEGRKVLKYSPLGREAAKDFTEGDEINLSEMNVLELEQSGDIIYRIDY